MREIINYAIIEGKGYGSVLFQDGNFKAIKITNFDHDPNMRICGSYWVNF